MVDKKKRDIWSLLNAIEICAEENHHDTFFKKKSPYLSSLIHVRLSKISIAFNFTKQDCNADQLSSFKPITGQSIYPHLNEFYTKQLDSPPLTSRIRQTAVTLIFFSPINFKNFKLNINHHSSNYVAPKLCLSMQTSIKRLKLVSQL